MDEAQPIIVFYEEERPNLLGIALLVLLLLIAIGYSQLRRTISSGGGESTICKIMPLPFKLVCDVMVGFWRYILG